MMDVVLNTTAIFSSETIYIFCEGNEYKIMRGGIKLVCKGNAMVTFITL